MEANADMRMTRLGSLLMAVLLVVAGLLMVTGLLDWVIRVVGVICLLASVYFAYQGFRKRRP